MANDDQQGPVLGEYAVEKLKAKKIAVIDDSTAYGQGLADAFEKTAKAGGAKIVAREHTTDKDTDFKAILTRIKGKKPDLVFFGGIDAAGRPDGEADEVARHQGEASWAATACRRPNFIKLAGPRRRRRDGFLARAAERQDARRQGLPRQIHRQVRPDRALRALWATMRR